MFATVNNYVGELLMVCFRRRTAGFHFLHSTLWGWPEGVRIYNGST